MYKLFNYSIQLFSWGGLCYQGIAWKFVQGADAANGSKEGLEHFPKPSDCCGFCWTFTAYWGATANGLACRRFASGWFNTGHMAQVSSFASKSPDLHPWSWSQICLRVLCVRLSVTETVSVVQCRDWSVSQPSDLQDRLNIAVFLLEAFRLTDEDMLRRSNFTSSPAWHNFSIVSSANFPQVAKSSLHSCRLQVSTFCPCIWPNSWGVSLLLVAPHAAASCRQGCSIVSASWTYSLKSKVHLFLPSFPSHDLNQGRGWAVGSGCMARMKRAGVWSTLPTWATGFQNGYVEVKNIRSVDDNRFPLPESKRARETSLPQRKLKILKLQGNSRFLWGIRRIGESTVRGFSANLA